MVGCLGKGTWDEVSTSPGVPPCGKAKREKGRLPEQEVGASRMDGFVIGGRCHPPLTRPQIRAAAQDLPQEQSERVHVGLPEGRAPVLEVQSLVQELRRHVPLGASLEREARRAENHVPGTPRRSAGPCSVPQLESAASQAL